jgi:exodeoxyribonuclease VII small subunit
MSAKKAESKAPRYAEAMEELETILEDLESESIEVDELASKVKRASQLIQLCRERLASTRLEIEQVVADLDTLEDGDTEDEA